MEKQKSTSAASCVLEKENARLFDEKSGLWYEVYWDEVLGCHVTRLAPGQKPVVTVAD
jgi:hypothetical protein